MALTKTVNIDGKDVTFRASAAIPRIYRNKFHRDIYKDLHDLQKSIDENDPEIRAKLYTDIAHPINAAAREKLEKAINIAYFESFFRKCVNFTK